MQTMTATYSPDDNKLRLYSATRLPADIYARVRAAGFIFAPKQDLFVAPSWTPEREDLLIDLCGEIDDEDTSLVDRAEERAERFEGYSEARAADAAQASTLVSSIADGIPLGQPILVGHHSERHARKDAERIEAGMRRAVKAFETAQYWQSRAAGAIRHAKYKERPDVRARRIKGLEADLRKCEKNQKQTQGFLRLWSRIDQPDTWQAKDGSDRKPDQMQAALTVANYDHVSQAFPLADYPRSLPANQYEGQMSLWSALKDGIITPEQARRIAEDTHGRYLASLARWIDHYNNRLAYERAMLAESGGIVTDKTGPEKGGACRCWASPRGGWSYIQKVNKVSVTVLDNWGNGGANFTRTIQFDKLARVMSAADVATARAEGRIIEAESGIGFFLAGSDRPTAPKPEPPARPLAPVVEAMRESLRAGVQVVAAPNLFPTPPVIAAQMIEAADVRPQHRVLEPSAGTGNLIVELANGPEPKQIVAVELNPVLAEGLRQRWNDGSVQVRCADFLACNGDLGAFDRIVMNPPFDHGSDIAHVQHARHMLAPGGRLVALCANGPRQQAALRPIADEWIELPAGSFAGAGTNVNVVMLTING